MACKYIFKGKLIGSEIELDDFLLEKYPYYKNTNDVVFLERNNIENDIYQKIDNAQKNYNSELNLKNSVDIENISQTDSNTNITGHLSVTLAMTLLKNPYPSTNSKKSPKGIYTLTPYFDEDALFSKKLQDWSKGIYTDEEKELFFGNKEPLIINENDSRISTMVLQIKDKWEFLRKNGDITHAILLLFFSSFTVNNKKEYVFNMTDISLLNYIQTLLKNDTKLSKDFLEYLDNDGGVLFHKTIDVGKQILQEIKKHYSASDHINFMPEVGLYAKFAEKLDKYDSVIGRADLICFDEHGDLMLIDFKTSIHGFDPNKSYKTISYLYLLEFYKKLLDYAGINPARVSTYICPIHLGELSNDGTKWKLGNVEVKYEGALILNLMQNEHIAKVVSYFLPRKTFFTSLTSQDLHKKVKELMTEAFSKSFTNIDRDPEQIKTFLEEEKAIYKNEDDVYVCKIPNSSKEFIAKTKGPEGEADVFKLVLDWYTEILTRNNDLFKSISDALARALTVGHFENLEDLPKLLKTNRGMDENHWLLNMLKLYGNHAWKIVKSDTFNDFGIICVLNTADPTVFEFLKISGRLLKYNIYKHSKTSGREEVKTILGAFGSEVEMNEKTKPNSFILDANIGNIELMETMMVINMINNFVGGKIGKISVMNPYLGQLITAPNHLLEYSFNALAQNSTKITLNMYSKDAGKELIKFTSLYDNMILQFNDIFKIGTDNTHLLEYQFNKLKGCRSELDAVINCEKEDRIENLRLFIKKLDEINSSMKSMSFDNINTVEFTEPFLQLLLAALLALSHELHIDYKLQLEDHGAFLEDPKFWKNGYQSNMLDNAGNLSSEVLNNITNILLLANLNTRDRLLKVHERLREILKKVKDDNNYTMLEDELWGNQNRLYKDLLRDPKTCGGELMFKRPEEIVNPNARELLEFILETINDNRYEDKELMQQDKDTGEGIYYYVPLMLGGIEALSTTHGILKALTMRIKDYSPIKAYKRLREKTEGVDYSDNNDSKVLELQMSTMFDKQVKGDWRDARSQILAKHQDEIGLDYFEHNLETLLLQHSASYIFKEEMDDAFPIIRAAVFFLHQSGININSKFADDLDYMHKFIKSKIFKLSILSKKEQVWAPYLNLLKHGASVLTLGFSPVQCNYLTIQHLWVDLKVHLSDVTDRKVFSLKNFTKGIKLAYSEFFKKPEETTLPSEINKLYALNDMDMSLIGNNYSSAKHGLIHFGRIAFKFTTRPDYYSRLSLFLTLMEADGCLDAHHIVNGKIIYNCKEDQRYAAFLNDDYNNPDYENAKGRYYAAAKQFVSENTKVYNEKTKEWEFFKIDMKNHPDLPRAYSSREAESNKAFADELYGYYSEEKKSLIMETLWGGLWLQMKTFWSSKKNLYLSKQGTKLQGLWEPATIEVEENGKKVKHTLYFKEENGKLTDEMVDDPSSGVPVVVWNGKWQEGILLTLSKILSLNPQEIIDNYKYYYNNPDPRVRKAFIENLRRLIIDLGMWFIGGGLISNYMMANWVKSMIKDNKKKNDLLYGFAIANAQILLLSLRNSFLDFNFLDSIGEPLYNWQPFAFSVVGTKFENLCNAAFGDQKFSTTLINTCSATKQTSEFWRALANL